MVVGSLLSTSDNFSIILHYIMKKIKKNLKTNGVLEPRFGFGSGRFINLAGKPVEMLKSTHTIFFLSALPKHHRNSWVRFALKNFWTPTKINYRYTGKSYRVRVKQNVLFFRFNKAHKTYMFHMGNKLDYFKNKGFRIRLWQPRSYIFNFKRTISLLRPRNRFTSRGIWNRKSFYLKKKGKVSGYR